MRYLLCARGEIPLESTNRLSHELFEASLLSSEIQSINKSSIRINSDMSVGCNKFLSIYGIALAMKAYLAFVTLL